MSLQKNANFKVYGFMLIRYYVLAFPKFIVILLILGHTPQ